MASEHTVDMRTSSAIEKYEPLVENEDESDQAKARYFISNLCTSFWYQLFIFSLCQLLCFCSITWKAMRSTI